MADDFDPDSIETFADETSEDHVRLSKADLKKLRNAAKTPAELRRENAELKREKLVRNAQLDSLSERQVSVLAREAGDDATPEDLRTLAVELRFIDPPEKSDEEKQQEQLDQEAQAHGDIAAASVGGNTVATRQPTGKDYEQWPADKRMRLQMQHPDIAEAMMRNPEAPVQLPQGFA